MTRLAPPVLARLLPGLLALVPPAQAQVALDGSLGPAGSVPLVGGVYDLHDGLGCYSGGGGCGSPGPNLFFSFGGAVGAGKSGFDVGPGQTALFSASLGTPERVIARVTSGARSQINGRLASSIPGADLFLLNPSGVSLGDGAQLDLQGSFYASTADVLRFEDSDLPTGDAGSVPLLSSAPPEAFGFTGPAPALVEVARTNALRVPPGETLSIVGGDVFVTSRPGFGVPDVINAPGAAVEIASAAGPVDIPVRLADLDLDAVDPAALGRVEVSTFARVRVSGAGEVPSGRVLIRGGQFALASDAQIVAKNDSQTVPALGPVDVGVTGDLVVDGANTQIQSWSNGAASAGDVRLSGDRVRLRNGADLTLFNGGVASHAGQGPDAVLSGRLVELDTNASLLIRSLSSGRAGSATLDAREAIILGGGASVVSDLLAGGPGGGGEISLTAPSVRIGGGAALSTLNAGSGTGAGIGVAAGELVVTDGGGIASGAGAVGAGGRIRLDVGSLAVTDAGRIISDTAEAPGGRIEVFAESMLVSNAGDRAEATVVQALNGGAIAVEVHALELIHGGQISTRTEGAAPAGELRVHATDRVSVSGIDDAVRPSGLFSRSGAAATADGGLLSVEARVLEVEDGAQLSSSTFGKGNAGPIELRASERIRVRGGESGFSVVAASARPGSTGDGAAIAIHTDRLELLDGGQVSTSTFGPGHAGNIEAHARTIEISGVDPATGLNPSGFFSRSVGAAGDGGRVELFASESVSMSDGGLISTSSSFGGLAGDIAVDAGERFEMRDSLVTTEADASAGGNVKIAADELVYLLRSSIQTLVRMGAGGGGDVAIDPVHTVLNESHVTASAVGGPGGNILIASDHYFPSGTSFLDASSQEDVAGVIEVTAPDTELASSLAPLPAGYLDASSQLERECAARTARAGSFVVRVRESTLEPPDAALHASEARGCRSEEGTP